MDVERINDENEEAIGNSKGEAVQVQSMENNNEGGDEDIDGVIDDTTTATAAANDNEEEEEFDTNQ